MWGEREKIGSARDMKKNNGGGKCFVAWLLRGRANEHFDLAVRPRDSENRSGRVKSGTQNAFIAFLATYLKRVSVE